MKNLFGEEQSEKEIQDLIRSALASYAHVYNVTTGVFKVGSGKRARWIRTFPTGTPDLMGFRKSDGKFFYIEVKNAKGRLSKEQKEFSKWVDGFPVLYGVARTVEDAFKILEIPLWE
ncbi:VRR-NUC domain-containing protein [Peptoniphilus sp.]|jgi:hypothetical protein|uniref:VRR-NUC domain-containing protein n=1 Tax=Peptoniphilus sp. TaxID=1971214 RepID=UPI003D8C21DC